jgi:nucleotide-binding universal stress UspA family protein
MGETVARRCDPKEIEMSTSVTDYGIVVGVDGSASATAAICWAARDAALRNVALTLVHVVDAAVAAWPQTPMPPDVGQWQNEQGQKVLNDAVKIAKESTQGAGSTRINSEIFFSATVPALVRLSKQAEMMVVGCRGRGAFARTLLGSVSSGLVQRAHCPVAVISDEDPLMPDPAQAPVLVGIDGSPASELATAIAFDEASRRGVDLIALHAWTDTEMSDYLPAVDWSVMKTIAEETLAERLAGWQERYPDVNVRRRVVSDQPARQLVEWSDGAQLVVVGSHGRGGFAGMLVGSVSLAVVHSARMPVIVARQS